MLAFDLARQLYDALPAFRAHQPQSGDWFFREADGPAVPCLVDTDGSRMTIYDQRDDDRPGELIQHAEDSEVLPFAWCPRLDQLIALAAPEGYRYLNWRPKDEAWEADGRFIQSCGLTPEEAVARWILALAAERATRKEPDNAPEL